MIRLLVEYVDEDDERFWFASSPDTPGCWAEGETERAAMDSFCEVFVAWCELKEANGDDDLPPFDLTYTGVAP